MSWWPSRIFPLILPSSPPKLRLETRPVDQVPETHITSLDDLIGKRLREPAYAGEIILTKRLLDDTAGSMLANSLTPGKRAMTLRIDEISGHAGFLLPGSHVDIISLKSGQKAQTVLKNIKVIAVGQNLSVEGNNVKAATVTLEVDPRQAETLAEVSESGSVRLVLRQRGDDTNLELDQPEPPNPTAAERPAVYPVNIIRGMESQTITVTEPGALKAAQTQNTEARK
jgi:pilus assembly protein CpaB